jgi:protein-tyrosine phosphatase
MKKTVEDINVELEGQISGYLEKSQNIEQIKQIKKNKNTEFGNLTDVMDEDVLNFLKIAEVSREMTDLDCGIITTKISAKESKIPIVGGEENAGITIRDGRFKYQLGELSPKSHPSESKYTWIGQMAITAQGVSKLLEFGTKSNNYLPTTTETNTISNAFKDSLEKINQTKDPKEYKKIVLSFNKTLHNYVKKQNLEFKNGDNIEKLNSDKKITKAIDTARHFAQLELEHTHNITISNNYEKDIIQTNLIVNSNHKKNDFNNTDWHKELNPVSKSFFEKFKDKIESGVKVISSRLKNLVGLPANTNAYMSFNHEATKYVEGSLTQMGTPNFRTAALANTKGDDAYTNTKAAVENMVSLNNEVNPKSKGLVVLNLNNTVFFDRKERKIRKNTERACNEIDPEGNSVEYKNVPINGSSAWSYLFGENKQKKFERIIDVILEAERDGKTLLIQCKSGKDRTGYAQALKNSVEYQRRQNSLGDSMEVNKSMSLDYMSNYDDKTQILKEIKKNNVFTNYTKDHVQEYQAGGVGGSLGVNALKSGGFTLTGGTQFLNDIGAGNSLNTNGLDKLNKFKAVKDTENDLEETRGQNVSNKNARASYGLDGAGATLEASKEQSDSAVPYPKAMELKQTILGTSISSQAVVPTTYSPQQILKQNSRNSAK